MESTVLINKWNGFNYRGDNAIGLHKNELQTTVKWEVIWRRVITQVLKFEALPDCSHCFQLYTSTPTNLRGKYFQLHHICLTVLVTGYFSEYNYSVQWKLCLQLCWFLSVCDKLKNEVFLYGLRQLFYLLSQINYLKSSRISWKKHRHRAGNRAVISELMKCLLVCFSQDDVTEWCIAPKQSYIEDEHRQGTFHHNEFFYF